MRLRRFTGLLLTLLTLHLNLLGADVACVKHGGHEGAAVHSVNEHAADAPNSATHTMMMPNHASHGQAAAMHAASGTLGTRTAGADLSALGHNAPPCDLPQQPNCCKALASCSVAFVADNDLDVTGILRVSQVITPIAMTVPPSERAAPDPPPPKA